MRSTDGATSPDTITIAVCAKNAADCIERCLQSARAAHPAEVIVVDGGSRDHTQQIAGQYADRVLSDDGKQLAYARQLAAEASNTEFVLFLDADAELPDDQVPLVMLKELLRNHWAAIHAQLIDPHPVKTYWEEGEDLHWRLWFNRPGEKSGMSTSVCLIRREAILRIRFDAFFGSASEDGDFFYRLGKSGGHFGVSTAVAFHTHRASFEEFVRQRVRNGQGNARMAWKHSDLRWGELAAPLGIAFGGIARIQSTKQRLRLLPFYSIWGVSLGLGTLVECTTLLLGRIQKAVARE